MRNIEFIPSAFKEYQEWIETDRKIAIRIGDLIRDILRNPCHLHFNHLIIKIA